MIGRVIGLLRVPSSSWCVRCSPGCADSKLIPMWSSFLANINSELHVVFNQSYTYTYPPPSAKVTTSFASRSCVDMATVQPAASTPWKTRAPAPRLSPPTPWPPPTPATPSFTCAAKPDLHCHKTQCRHPNLAMSVVLLLQVNEAGTSLPEAMRGLTVSQTKVEFAP